MAMIRVKDKRTGRWVQKGSIVVYNMSDYPKIGMIIEIDKENNEYIATIRQPSGNCEKKSLLFDFDNNSMALLVSTESKILKRWFELSMKKEE